LFIQLFVEAVQKSLGSDGFLVARFRQSEEKIRPKGAVGAGLDRLDVFLKLVRWHPSPGQRPEAAGVGNLGDQLGDRLSS